MRDLVRRVDRLQRLAAFEAAGRLGSFTAAARELGTTQPAVTRQLASLERSLGVELFARTSNRSSLTEAGRRLLGHVGVGFDAIERGLDEVAGSADDFTLAAHPGIAQMVLLPRLDELRDALGDRDLRLRLFDRDAELEHGTHHAAIRVGDGRFAGHDAEPLVGEVVVPVAAPSVAERHGLSTASSAADVLAAPLVHMDDADRPWMSWSGWLAEFGLALRPAPGRVLLDGYPMALQRTLLCYGVGLGWRPLVDEYVERGALVVVGPEVRSANGYHVTWPAGPPNDAVRALVTWLRDVLGDPAGSIDRPPVA